MRMLATAVLLATFVAAPAMAQRVDTPSQSVILEDSPVTAKPTQIQGNVKIDGVADRVNVTSSGRDNVAEVNVGAIGNGVTITGNATVVGVANGGNTTASGTGNVARTNIGTIGK